MVARYGPTEAAALLGVSRSTWHRYRYGQQCPPRSVCLVLATLEGWPVLWPGFRGWQYWPVDGRLYCNGLRDGFTPADIRSLFWLRQQVRELRRQGVQAETCPPCQGVA